MYILLAIVLALFLAPTLFKNLIGPLLIWRNQRIPALARPQPLPPPQFLAKRGPEFHRYHNAFLAAGYTYCVSSKLDDPQVDSAFSLYVDPRHHTTGVVNSIDNQVGDTVTYAEIAQGYTDGSCLDVSNSPQIGAYPRIRWKRTFQYPDVTEVAELIEHHARIRAKLIPDAVPEPVAPDTVLNDFAKFIRLESDELVRLGICQQEIGPDGKRSLTFWGACTLTWKVVEPGLWLWRWWAGRRARRALEG